MSVYFGLVVDRVRIAIPGLRFYSAQATVSTVARACFNIDP
jgi:hypothetical protein